MTATQAMTGYKTKIEVFRSSAWFKFGEVTKITPPKLTSSEVDATHLESEANTEESIKGLRKTGSSPIDMNYVPGSPTDLFCLDWDATGDTAPVRITYPNNVVDTFNAYVLDYGPGDITVDGKLQATANLKAAGAITRVG